MAILKFFWVVWGISAVHMFYRYGWRSWKPWVINTVSYMIFYWWIGVISVPKEPLGETQGTQVQAEPAIEAQTPDGVYLLNGHNRSATITVIGDTWYFESTESYSEPEFGEISSIGELTNSEGYPRGNLLISMNRINYLGYSFYKK